MGHNAEYKARHLLRWKCLFNTTFRHREIFYKNGREAGGTQNQTNLHFNEELTTLCLFQSWFSSIKQSVISFIHPPVPPDLHIYATKAHNKNWDLWGKKPNKQQQKNHNKPTINKQKNHNKPRQTGFLLLNNK